MTKEHAARDNGRIISHCRTIDAPAAAIFAILANPNRHHDLDGSGMVRGPSDESAPRLSKGAVFEMKMRQAGAPYRTANCVVEFDEPHLIAWQVHPAGPLSTLRELLVGGHRWRYRLTPDGAGSRVCEEWDYTGSASPWVLRMMRFPSRNSSAIKRSLDRLAELTTATRDELGGERHLG